jgi:hypothetical protein
MLYLFFIAVQLHGMPQTQFLHFKKVKLVSFEELHTAVKKKTV